MTLFLEYTYISRFSFWLLEDLKDQEVKICNLISFTTVLHCNVIRLIGLYLQGIIPNLLELTTFKVNPIFNPSNLFMPKLAIKGIKKTVSKVIWGGCWETSSLPSEITSSRRSQLVSINWYLDKCYLPSSTKNSIGVRREIMSFFLTFYIQKLPKGPY